MKINRPRVVFAASCVTIAFAVLIGIGLGSTFAGVVNTVNQEDFGRVKMPEASKVYDIKGRLITELFGEQKREIVSINEMPPFLIQALLTREDREFYNHGGINTWRTFLAAVNNLIGRNRQGASTITQQLAGLLYANRRDISIFRKITELYYAFQLEKKLSKDEILELYLNQMYFGHGCYGVEAACQFHFGHSVKDITPAEAAMIVIQLANWNEYSPRKNPVKARNMQENVLTDMVSLGYITKDAADKSFNDFWRNYDLTKPPSSAFELRKDRAPYFTEYVRQKLDEMIYGNMNVYQDGLEIYTTLNLDFQKEADEIMKDRLASVNEEYEKELSSRGTDAELFFLPAVDLLSLNFNMPHMHVNRRRHMIGTIDAYAADVNPVVDIASTMFGLEKAKDIARKTYAWERLRTKTTHVEGALVCVDPYTGYIYAMVGGREFNSENQFNYATQGHVSPGSSFKPLFYSEAIEEKKITPSTILKDVQMVFEQPSGEPYIPNNYGEVFRGDVMARDALAHSLNIPAINVLQIIGFDRAISMASRLLGITNPDEIQRTFPRSWSLALGVITTSPLNMARAFSTFPNGGKGIDPIGILYVKDRDGKIIAEPERDRLARAGGPGGLPQLIKPETAYIMTNMLQTTVKSGTVSYASNTYLRDVKYPFAGKTGTSQNWHDAWTIGFSPYFVTAVWFGFDQGGGSLGVRRTGSTLASPVWAKFMRKIHDQLDADRTLEKKVTKTIENRIQGTAREVSQEAVAGELGIPTTWLSVIDQYRDFNRPDGLVEADVCTLSGLRPSPYCRPDDVKTEIFYPDTVPEKECTMCAERWQRQLEGEKKIRDTIDLEINVQKPDLIDPNQIPDDFDTYQRNKNSILKKVKPEDEKPGPKDSAGDSSINPYLND
ncbi:MAG: PBP1A family penicillin-binding protein [Spirochaetales bacterium]|nr:PBP1A family penicillin-binding protein [Spirochaetales bacterium]